MPTAQHRREAEEITRLFQAAIAQQSAEAMIEATRLWHQTPVSISTATAGAWLDAVIRMILLRRARSRELGLAYYRLMRALRTGATIGDTRRDEPRWVSIRQLREEFEALRNGDELPEPEVLDPDVEDDEDLIEVELIFDIEDYMLRDDEDTEREIREELPDKGPGKRDRIEGDDLSDEEIHESSTNDIAGDSQRRVADGGRQIVHAGVNGDPRALAYARVSTTGTPCGWCAMLISRGAVYKSEQSAYFSRSGEKYHDDDKCISVPVFNRSDFDGELFAMNRAYGEYWPEVTKGLYGKDAVSRWRQFVRVTDGVPVEDALDTWREFLRVTEGLGPRQSWTRWRAHRGNETEAQEAS